MKGASGMHFEVHVRGGDGCCDSFVARGDTLEQAVEYAREWIKPKTKTKGEEIADAWRENCGADWPELIAAIDKAIAEERAECVRVAEAFVSSVTNTEYNPGWERAAERIAESIRCRKP
jgi:hypothetical protein